MDKVLQHYHPMLLPLRSSKLGTPKVIGWLGQGLVALAFDGNPIYCLILRDVSCTRSSSQISYLTVDAVNYFDSSRVHVCICGLFLLFDQKACEYDD